MTPSAEELTALTLSGMNITKMATHYGVCVRTIELWRKKAGVTARCKPGGSPIRLPYNKMDKMLEDNYLSERTIARRCRCSIGAVSQRYRMLHPDSPIRNATRNPHTPGPDEAKFIPPDRRLEMAVKVKAIRLGVSYDYARTVWLKGPAGRQFLNDGGYW